MHKKFTDYQKSLERSYLSENTVKVYLTSVYTYYNIYNEVSAKNLDAFKKYLETHYCPRSANLHIIGFNRYLKFLGKPELKLPSIRVRQKNYLDDVISYQDYPCQSGWPLYPVRSGDLFFVGWTIPFVGVHPTIIAWTSSFIGVHPTIIAWTSSFIGVHPTIIAWTTPFIGVHPTISAWTIPSHGIHEHFFLLFWCNRM